MKNQSRLTRVAEEKARKTAIFYIIATIVFFVLLVAFGTTIISRISSFVTSGRSEGPRVTDTTPPPPPSFRDYPSVVNNESISIEGSGEPQSTVYVKINDRTEQILVDNQGMFSIPVTLSEGVNTISATSTDPSGNKSHDSNVLTIEVDKKGPDLTLTQPTDNQAFNGKNKTIRIEGTTNGNRVRVNDFIAIIDLNGKFSYSYSLSEGENKITVKSEDEAINETKVEITVTYTP